jgi:hypothetical protein
MWGFQFLLSLPKKKLDLLFSYSTRLIERGN